MFNRTREGLMITDRRWQIVAVNQAFVTLTGYTEIEALGQTPNVLNASDPDAFCYSALRQRLSERGHWAGEIRSRRRSEEIIARWLSVEQVKDALGQTSHYACMFSEFAPNRRADTINASFPPCPARGHST